MYTPVNEARVSCGLISPFSETQGLAIPWQTHGILFALWSAQPWQLEDKHCIISQTNKRGVDASPLAHTRKPREIHHGSVIRFFFLSLTWGPDKSRPSWLRWTQRPISDSPIRITPRRSGNIYIIVLRHPNPIQNRINELAKANSPGHSSMSFHCYSIVRAPPPATTPETADPPLFTADELHSRLAMCVESKSWRCSYPPFSTHSYLPLFYGLVFTCATTHHLRSFRSLVPKRCKSGFLPHFLAIKISFIALPSYVHL